MVDELRDEGVQVASALFLPIRGAGPVIALVVAAICAMALTYSGTHIAPGGVQMSASASSLARQPWLNLAKSRGAHYGRSRRATAPQRWRPVS